METKRFTKKNNISAEVAEQKRHNRSRNRTLFYVVLLLSVAAVFAVIFVFVFLKVEEINVLGNTAYDKEKILEAADINIGDNLMQLLGTNKGDIISEKLPYIEKAEIKIRLPHSVDINIHEAKGSMYTEIDSNCYILSDELKVLKRVSAAEAKAMGICHVKTGAVSRCIVGEKCSFADEREYETITTLYALFKKNGIEDKILSIDAENRFKIYFDYDGRFNVYMGDMDYSDIKISFLVEILKQFDPEDTGSIDLSKHTEAAVNLD